MESGFFGSVPHYGQNFWGTPHQGVPVHKESISHADGMLLHQMLRPGQSPQQSHYDFGHQMSNNGVSDSNYRAAPLPVSHHIHQPIDTGVGSVETNYDDEDEDETYDDDDKETLNQERDRSRSISGSPSISSKDSLNGFRPHAAVEKRYRQTVNAKLQQLHTMIPATGRFALESSGRGDETLNNSATEQAAKPVVLDKAIQYATHLIETYQRYDEDINKLRQQVRDLLGDDGLPTVSGPHVEAGVVAVDKNA